MNSASQPSWRCLARKRLEENDSDLFFHRTTVTGRNDSKPSFQVVIQIANRDTGHGIPNEINDCIEIIRASCANAYDRGLIVTT